MHSDITKANRAAQGLGDCLVDHAGVAKYSESIGHGRGLCGFGVGGEVIRDVHAELDRALKIKADDILRVNICGERGSA